MSNRVVSILTLTIAALAATPARAQQPDFQLLPPVREASPLKSHTWDSQPSADAKRQRATEVLPPAHRPADGNSRSVVSEARPVDLRKSEPQSSSRVVLSDKFKPWWQEAVLKPLRRSPRPLSVDVNSLVMDALRHSSRVRAISDNAVIAETALARAAAEFDVHTFVESKFVRTSVPTGSSLDAGAGATRLRENDWFYSAGIRRKNQHGGRLEASQQIGTRNSNSTFFVPTHQGNSRLTLSYNQPLMNGAGEAYNTSLILLASLDTQIAVERTAAELQDHLLSVTTGLWELYLQRSILLQKQRNLERAEVIRKRLEKRRDVDSLASQIARARAAVAMRRTDLIRAQASIRNAEARLRALVNSPELLSHRAAELLPVQPPSHDYVSVKLEEAVLTALENRPEINSAARRIEAARLRLDVARNQLLPVLDLVLETYVSGIRGGNDIGRAWVDQFGVGEPSYTAGLVFEVPLYRRAARAEHLRRRAELRQLSSQFQATVETLHAEVEVAVREIETSFDELRARFESMAAARADADYLKRRWEVLPGEDRAASFLLEDLLDAQDRLAAAELGFAQSQVNYAVSLSRLKRTTGTLLRHERVELLRGCEEGTPVILFEQRSN